MYDSFVVTPFSSYVRKFALFCIFALSCSLFICVSLMLNQSEIWFSMMDQDSALLIDTLRVNSVQEPIYRDHPSLGVYVLYGYLFKAFQALGIPVTTEFTTLAASSDPLLLLPNIFYKGRWASILICIVSSMIFGVTVMLFSNRLEGSFIMATSLFLLSGGTWIQSLIIRSELSAVFFMLIAFFFLALAYKTERPSILFLYYILTGFFGGIAVLTKVQIAPMLFIILSIAIYISAKKSDEFLAGARSVLIFVLPFLFIAFIGFMYNMRALTGNHLGRRAHGLYVGPALISLVSVLFLRNKSRVVLMLAVVGGIALGFLISLPIVFVLTNTGAYRASWLFKMLVLPTEMVSYYGLSFYGGVLALGKSFGRFLTYYITWAPYLIVLPIVSLLLNQGARRLTLMLMGCGLLMCMVSSLRYFGPHYLIFSDGFFAASLAFAILTLCRDSLAVRWRVLSASLPVVIAVVMGGLQLQYIRLTYPTFNHCYRNIVAHVMTAMPPNAEYHELMKRRYGNEEALVKKIFSDVRLNGSREGIQLSTKHTRFVENCRSIR